MPATNWRAIASPPGMLVSRLDPHAADRVRTGRGRPARGSARTGRGSTPSSRRTAGPRSRRTRSRGRGRRDRRRCSRSGPPCGRSRAAATARRSRCARDRRPPSGGPRPRPGRPARRPAARRPSDGGAGDVARVDHVDHPAEGVQDLVPARVVDRSARPSGRAASRCRGSAPRPRRRAAPRRRPAARRAARRRRSPCRPAVVGPKLPLDIGRAHVGVGGRLQVEVDRRRRPPAARCCRGEMALMIVPSGRQASPSALKPGPPVKPRSIAISTRVPGIVVPRRRARSPAPGATGSTRDDPSAVPAATGSYAPVDRPRRRAPARRAPARPAGSAAVAPGRGWGVSWSRTKRSRRWVSRSALECTRPRLTQSI